MKRANSISFYRINNHLILGNELFRCKNGVINSRKNKNVQIYNILFIPFLQACLHKVNDPYFNGIKVSLNKIVVLTVITSTERIYKS